MNSTSQRGSTGSGKKGKPGAGSTKSSAKKSAASGFTVRKDVNTKSGFMIRGGKDVNPKSGHLPLGKVEGEESVRFSINALFNKKRPPSKTYVHKNMVFVTVAGAGAPIKGHLERLAHRKSDTPFEYWKISQYNAIDRIEAVREGLPPGVFASVADDLNVEQGFLIDHLGFARSTIARKVKSNTPLNLRESEGLLGVAQLIGLVETMVAESGSPEGFDAAAWVGRWISRPHPALGNRLPVELLDTAEGQNLVASILQRSQSGAYA